MIRALLIALLMGACGDVPLLPDDGPVCEGDEWLEAVKVLPKRFPVACPAGMPLQFEGAGCVPCVYVDSCGAEKWQVAGCSPAAGVWCHSEMAPCPEVF